MELEDLIELWGVRIEARQTAVAESLDDQLKMGGQVSSR